MRDQEAVDEIEDLNSNNGNATVQLARLLELAPYFSQSMVAAFVEKAKERLGHVKHLLLQALETANNLTTEETSSLAFAAVLLGGSAWAYLPRMFASLDAKFHQDVLSRFSALLVVKFGEDLASWVCLFWKYLEE